jgi:SAM-dependent methyltransferase
MAPAMADALAYYGWIAARIAPFVGRRILDVGAGHGTLLSSFLDRDRLIALECEPEAADRLRLRFAGVERVRVESRNLLDPGLADALSDERIDTVLCLNVLEHQSDDRAGLAALRSLLAPGRGSLVLQVPAHPWLFGSLDSAAGHHRRYGRRELRAKLDAAGYRVRTLGAMNLVGVAGWWYAGRLRRYDLNSPGLDRLVRAYDRWVVSPSRRLEKALPPPIGLSWLAIAS